MKMKMKKITTLIILLLVVMIGYSQKHDPDSGYTLTKDTLKLNEVTISAFLPYQATSLMPITFKNVYKVDLELKNYGQEPSRILETTPSITTYSESGGNWGYSYIRLRGIDQTRINVTLNGIPMNEPEDQGCYFSNYPDFLQSVEMLQIQRGTGMTKNGSASFVGSMNFESFKPNASNVNFYLGGGSWNSTKFSINTQQNWKKGSLYVSVSDIRSAGYKEHSGNHSSSAFLVGNYRAGKNMFKLVAFAGQQQNQLAWFGVPMDSINVNRRYNANTTREVDHFNQYHIQFHHIYNINTKSRFTYSLYYNYLNGFYTFDGVSIGTPDLYGYHLVSNFFGGNVNYFIKFGRLDLYTGINGYKYNRNHQGSTDGVDTYTNTGYRNDLSGFLKGILNLGNFNFYGDVQYRYTNFIYNGDVSLPHFEWNFFNFSAGVEFKVENNILYYSIGKTHREPIRNDMFWGNDNLLSDSVGNPVYKDLKPETVLDQEFGYRYIKGGMRLNINLFYMIFNNELVLTGKYGTTGLPLHINVDESYRTGLEFDFKYKWKFGLTFIQNLSYNYSKITVNNIQTTPVLTPEWITNTELSYNYKWFVVGVSGRYQSWSYIDQGNDFTIPNYYTINAMVGLRWDWGEWNIYLNNITDQKYLSNGMLGWDNVTPLYFVGSPFNLFTGIKFKLN